jgi:hypothetical protein
MYNYDLNKFIEWQALSPNHSVSIKIEVADRYSKTPKNNISVWVYDYSLQHGQFVNSVEEIDILGLQKEKDKRDFEAIRKRNPDIIIPVAPGININLGGGDNG